MTDRVDLSGARIGCAMTGSFCTFKRAFAAWRALKEAGAELLPIMSFNAASLDTRFYPASEAIEEFEEICGHAVLRTIPQVEPIGPKRLIDLLVVAPCTGNTLGKLANGLADTPVALAAKSHLRNGRPLLLAVSTNDALGTSAQNIGRLLNRKHVYFVPFAQDDPAHKPNSCVARFELLPEAAAEALRERQLQPILTGNNPSC